MGRIAKTSCPVTKLTTTSLSCSFCHHFYSFSSGHYLNTSSNNYYSLSGLRNSQPTTEFSWCSKIFKLVVSARFWLIGAQVTQQSWPLDSHQINKPNRILSLIGRRNVTCWKSNFNGYRWGFGFCFLFSLLHQHEQCFLYLINETILFIYFSWSLCLQLLRLSCSITMIFFYLHTDTFYQLFLLNPPFYGIQLNASMPHLQINIISN